MAEEIVLAPLEIAFEPAELSADFDGMRKRLAEFMEPYEGMDDEALEGMSRKELADQRAAINRLINSVEDGRKAIKAEYSKPLKDFEEQVKELLEPARAARDTFNAHINRKDELKRESRREALETYYANDVAASVPMLVAFDALYEPEWVKSDRAYKDAFPRLLEKADRLAKDWDHLHQMQVNDMSECERVLLKTLDLDQAIQSDMMRKAELDEIAALKEEPDYAYEPPVFEEIGPQDEPSLVEVKPEPEPAITRRERYRFEAWLTDNEVAALREWKNVNCIGAGWKFGKAVE